MGVADPGVQQRRGEPVDRTAQGRRGEALAPHRRKTQNRLAADPAKPSVSAIVRLTCGPASSVTGVSSMPGSRNDVFPITLMPRGAFIAVVTSAGRCPCATAVAA